MAASEGREALRIAAQRRADAVMKRGRFNRGGTIDLKNRQDASASPLDSIDTGFRRTRTIRAVEISGGDNNSVGAVAAESESATR
jgi:hypothetical protein